LKFNQVNVRNPYMPTNSHDVEMEQAAIEARVIRVIATTQDLPVEVVTPDKSFAELNIDSFAGINIVFELENEFDISIPDEGAQTMRSVNNAVAGVRQLLKEKGSQSA
jgi:acyl carrier protein